MLKATFDRHGYPYRKKFIYFHSRIYFFALIPFVLFSCRYFVNAEEVWTNSIKELLDHLNLSDLEAYLDQFSELNLWGSKSLITSLLNGDLHLDYTDFLSYLKNLFLDQIDGYFTIAITIFSVLLIFGIMDQIKGSLFSSFTSEMIYFAVYSFLLLLFMSIIGDVIFQCTSCVSNLKKQMELCFPLLLTLMASSGSTVSVGIYQPIVAFLSNGFTSIISNMIFPMGILVIVIVSVGNLSPELNVKSIKTFFSSTIKWIMGLILSVFSIFITVQGITAAQYDGISLKAAKYAVGNSVPMIGGFLSGGLDLVVAGSILLKNSLGSLSVILVFFSVCKPILSIFFFDLLLKGCSIMSDIVSARMSLVFQEVAEGVHFFLAGILCVTYFYLIIVLLLVCTGVALY